MASSPSSTLFPCLLFLIVVATSMQPIAGHLPLQKVTHLHFYFHEIQDGPNSTVVAVSTPRGGSAVSFGYVGLFDDLIKEGPEPESRLIGRAQGIVTTPTKGEQSSSILTAFEFVFTDGEYAGSSIAVFGKALDGDIFERAIIGGTGRFRLARGYTLSRMLDGTAPGLLVLEYHAYILQDDVDLPPSPFASSMDV